MTGCRRFPSAWLTRRGVAAAVALASIGYPSLARGASLPSGDPYASAPPYAVPAAADVETRPLATAGQLISLPGGIGTFRVVGIPDGLGVYALSDTTYRLYVNHEFFEDRGGPAGPLQSGARISQLELRRHAVLDSVPVVDSGRYAIEAVFDVASFNDVTGDVYAWVPNPPPLSQLCSAYLASTFDGFDREIYLAGEEAQSPFGFDGEGGLAWATVGGNAYPLRRVGRAKWENVVPIRHGGGSTGLIALEDAPADGDGLNAQLYMYVGEKLPESADPLARNGLTNGRLYVFVGDDPSRNSETTFTVKGSSTTGHWAQVNWALGDAGLDAQARSRGAFAFVRIEDGAFDRLDPSAMYFCSTGRPASVNPFGRLYRLTIDPAAPLDGATLTLLLDGSEGIVNPDNMDINVHGELAIQEDPLYDLESDLGLFRDSSVWIYAVADETLRRVAEVDRASATAHALAADPDNYVVPEFDRPGRWESSGIVDAERYFGRGAWLLDVQAHSLRIDPEHDTVEGGQLLFMRAPAAGTVSAGEDGASPVAMPDGTAPLQAVVSPIPASGEVTVRLRVREPGRVALRVYDASGALVVAPVPSWASAGESVRRWSGENAAGKPVAPGVYFIEVSSADARVVRRITVVR
jgi:hypothetical protein